MAANTAWGVDIGNRALKAIKLVREGDVLRIDDFDVIEHDTVLSNAGDNREALIQSALALFAQKHQFRKIPVAVGVSGQSSFARFIKLPPVEPKQIPNIVRFEAIQQIPFPLDDVEWSYQLFQSPESTEVEVGIFAMRKELVNQHIQYFTDSEMNVQVVQMNPLAVYNAMHLDGRVNETTMVIDLGAETTDLIIADANSIWLRSIPIGGNNFTEALVKAFKLNFQKGEELKRNAASSKYARQIFQAMRPVFADLVAEVQRSIGFYASVHRESKIGKIVGIGGTFKLPGLQKYLQQNLQLDVERLDSLGGGAPADPKAAATYNDNILSLVSAYGLAVQAMGDAKITSSLLPQHIRRERMWREKTKWFAAAAATIVLGTGVGYGAWFVHDVAYESQDGARKQVQQVLAQAKTLDAEWSKVEQAGSADRQRINNVRSLADGRDLWAQLLPDVISGLPQLPTDPAELKQAHPDRHLRQQVLIDTVDVEYQPDVSGALKAVSLAGYRGVAAKTGGGAGAGGPPPGQGRPSDDVINAMIAQAVASASAGPRGGGRTGGPAPQAAAAARRAAPAEEAEPAAAAQRGFIFTLRGTTPFTGGPGAPFRDTADFMTNGVAKALQALRNEKRLEGRRYWVARAEMINTQPLSLNTSRMDRIVKQYESARQAALGEVTGENVGFTGGTTGGTVTRVGARSGGGGAARPSQRNLRAGGGPTIDTSEIQRIMMERYGRQAQRENRPARTTAARTPAATETAAVEKAPELSQEELQKLAYQDRLTGEDIRQDWEFEVAVVVVIGPRPAAPATPAAPAANQQQNQ